MEVWSRFFSRSATLWLHFADFFWYHVLERVSSLMMGFCPLPGNMWFHSIDLDLFRIYWANLIFLLVFSFLHNIFVLTLQIFGWSSIHVYFFHIGQWEKRASGTLMMVNHFSVQLTFWWTEYICPWQIVSLKWRNILVTEGFSFLDYPWLFIFQSTIRL